MANEGWIVDEATECIESDASAAKNDAEARSYERAREEGFAFRVELLRRTWVDLDRNVWDEVEIERPLQRPFVEFCDRIIANQRAYLLCSKRATCSVDRRSLLSGRNRRDRGPRVAGWRSGVVRISGMDQVRIAETHIWPLVLAMPSASRCPLLDEVREVWKRIGNSIASRSPRARPEARFASSLRGAEPRSRRRK
jgi:hypothetical protein